MGATTGRIHVRCNRLGQRAMYFFTITIFIFMFIRACGLAIFMHVILDFNYMMGARFTREYLVGIWPHVRVGVIHINN
ncbi:hypothetical protein XELAEV_18004462mg [Xenopus laevis]|uniref:Uncharacterized protein n=1 Tax=Xenopus laevis TaxID=8355 RepID=A0A974BPQ1_XENLA|nr:hypothetical protein XELAEV_18004462mg [Xenopus laevis]